MTQYALERKESVVRRMLSSTGISILELAKESGISDATLYKWRNEAKAKGEAVTGNSKHPGKWSSSQKFAVVVETLSFNEAEFGEYCRKKGLFPEQVKRWREACEQANTTGGESARPIRAAVAAEKKRIKELERELRRKEKALAETAALLILRKKADAIWGEEKDA